MQRDLHELHEIEKGIRQLEEHHNDVLDLSTETNKKITDLALDLQQEITSIQEHTRQLKERIHDRITKAKRATVLMSLLAQKEEIAPINNRIDKQPYEFYATSEWFKKQLSERP